MRFTQANYMMTGGKPEFTIFEAGIKQAIKQYMGHQYWQKADKGVGDPILLKNNNLLTYKKQKLSAFYCYTEEL